MTDHVFFKNASSPHFFWLAFFSMFMVSSSVDTLTTSQFLTGSMTIVSNQGEFEMGFFSPESGKWFLATWYKSISLGTVVWIANRDAPLNDTSAILRVTQQGNLTLSLNSSNSIVWSSNHLPNIQNPIAQLLDSGNLVVRDANDADPNNYLWQSFDYPTDTLLPGVKFGKNFVTGIDRVLYSWKSYTDPSRGNYLFEFDTHGYPQHFLMINGTTPKFRSGPWNGIRFSGSPGLKPNPIYTFFYVFNQEEVYYSFELVNEAVKSRLVLQQDGVLRRLTWNSGTMGWTTFVSAPADNCDNYGQCYGNGICNMANSPVCGCLDKFEPKSKENWDNADWSGGCVRRIPLDCQKGDGFLRYENIKLPDTRNSWYNVTMTLRECREICSRNCSCTAYSNLNITNGGSGCLLWFDELMDIRQLPENGQDIYIRLASSEVAGSKWTTRKKIAVSLAVLAGAVLLGLVLGLFCTLRARNNRRKQQELELLQLEGVPQSTEQSQSNKSEKADLELPLFDLEKISIATDNFSHKNKIGEGGFGPVYKGVLEDGQEIAVKRLSKHSAQGIDEFKNEVIFIAKLQHRNLVRLLGCCIQGEEKLLIYEYMPNNSLDTFIFDETQCTLLDWPKRFNIINGIARGLLYLHQDSRLRIIHRDLKAANVLLDSEMNPKISDFGMARSFGGNDSEANTKRVVGTYGYMPPEYAVDGIFSVKSDVFSFGVLVLEIVSGQKNRGFYHPNHHHNLLGHAWLLHQEGRSMELIDDHLAESCHLAEILRSIHVSLLCVQQNPDDRPSMSSVILMLASEGSLAPPKEPGFFTERNVYFDPTSSSGKQTASSGKKDTSNEISITLLDAR